VGQTAAIGQDCWPAAACSIMVMSCRARSASPAAGAVGGEVGQGGASVGKRVPEPAGLGEEAGDVVTMGVGPGTPGNGWCAAGGRRLPVATSGNPVRSQITDDREIT
jgi:hypothetical protein